MFLLMSEIVGKIIRIWIYSSWREHLSPNVSTRLRWNMTLSSWLLTIIVLGVCAYAGILRPTGLIGRKRSEDEEERRRDLAAKWLNKDDR